MLSPLAVALLAVTAAACAALARAGDTFAFMKLDTQHVGSLELISSTTGRVSKTSDVTITFTWPYVEMTSDVHGGRLFVTAFPDNSSQAVLYEFDRDLALQRSWPDTDFWFFDLQYAPSQDALYGIKVVSTYGRVLSNFSAPAGADKVEAAELFALPYMWYVNASTFDHKTTRYFGLLNYFPGKPESVLDQQLVVCDFLASADCRVVPLSASAGVLHFIGFSCKTDTLYASAIRDGVMTVVAVDPYSGKVVRELLTAPAAELGPISVQDEAQTLSVFVKSRPGAPWQLLELDLASGRALPLRSFAPSEGYFAIAGAAQL